MYVEAPRRPDLVVVIRKRCAIHHWLLQFGAACYRTSDINNADAWNLQNCFCCPLKWDKYCDRDPNVIISGRPLPLPPPKQ